MSLRDVRSRTKQANYLNIPTGSGTDKAFEFLGTGFTELNEEPGAQTSSKRYINEKSTSKGITGYEWTSPFNADQIRSQKAIEYICGIGEMQKIGGDAETEYVIVDLDQKTAENEFKARQITVAIEVSKFGDNDGEMTCEGNFLGVGDVVPGKFNTSTKKFTPGAVIGG